MKRRWTCVLCAVLMGCMAAASVAQVREMRIDNALDANPMVGSGGSNSPGNTDSLGDLLKSNLYVTGQVRGLGGFRGTLPYRPSNQFRIDLPTSSMSGYLGRSVGLEDVLQGDTYRTRPYFDRSKTALGAGGILSGRSAVGTNVQYSTSLSPDLSRDLRVDALQDYRSLLPDQPGRLLSAPLQQPSVPYSPRLQSGEGSYPYRSYAPAGSDARLPAEEPAGQQSQRSPAMIGPVLPTRVGAGALFGVLSAQSRDRLARELYQMENAEGPVGTRIDASLDASLGEQYKLGPEQELPAELLAADANARPAEPYASRQDVTRPLKGVRRNADVFLDLLLVQRERLTQTGAVRPAEAPREGAGADLLAEPTAAPQRTIVEIAADKTILVHRLSGLRQDDVNRNLRAAEKMLKEGKYYAAADRFQLVEALAWGSARPGNPLPLTGAALAYFGAGEWYTAGLYFRKALERSDALAETRIDVGEMMDIKDVTAQLRNLERRLRQSRFEKPDPHLLLAGVWMHRNVGNDAEARRYARQLLQLTKKEKVMEGYAQTVLKDDSGSKPPAGDSKEPGSEK
ncbi:MAG TPA: hypothetical protein VM389_04275 [Phycisphaerae bacterium]|nr:hypothetical protein [Phycisphaerae bacterium]